MGEAMARVVDAIDVETFLACKTEDEAKELAEALAREMNLKLGDVVFLEQSGWGARVRLRTYVYRPGDRYGWLQPEEDEA